MADSWWWPGWRQWSSAGQRGTAADWSSWGAPRRRERGGGSTAEAAGEKRRRVAEQGTPRHSAPEGNRLLHLAHG
eukprot:9883631-Lingulodinium_polyedra.AAC.1